MKNMTKHSLMATIAGVAALSAGCTDVVICDSLCSTYVACQADANREIGCQWTGDTADIERDCEDACLDGVDRMGDKDKDALLECTKCVEGYLDGVTCSFTSDTENSYAEAFSLCSSKCSDPDFDKFWDEFDMWDVRDYPVESTADGVCE